MRMGWGYAIVGATAVLLTGWPGGAGAQGAGVPATPRPTPTLVVRSTDTADRVLQDFAHPCQAVFNYMGDLGIDVFHGSPQVNQLRARGWTIVGTVLGEVARTPAIAADPTQLRARMRAQLQNGPPRSWQGDAAQQTVAALDAALARFASPDATMSDDEAAGILLVALVMADPVWNARYRTAILYGPNPIGAMLDHGAVPEC